MGEYYEKDGYLYEKGEFGDRMISIIQHSPTGNWATDGMDMINVDKKLNGDIELTKDRDYINNQKTVVVIKKNPFQQHGQESEEYKMPLYGEENEEENKKEDINNIEKNNSNGEYYGGGSGSHIENKKMTTEDILPWFLIIGVVISVPLFLFLGFKGCVADWGKAGYNGTFKENFIEPLGVFFQYVLIGGVVIALLLAILKKVRDNFWY